MHFLIKVVCLWGLGDAIWLAAAPNAWGRFWLRGVEKISAGSKLPRAMALIQLITCLWMLSHTRSEKGQSR